MSHRVLSIDPITRRIKEYESMQSEQMEAIIEAIQILSEQGYNVGDKMADVLKKRANIKARNPK